MNTSVKLNLSEIHYRIAQLADVEKVYLFETNKRFSHIVDEYEQQMAVWSEPFRKESLEHYFKLGWSFLALSKNNEIIGFFLGQPLLFFANHTQTLWLEYISAIDISVSTELVDIAYRLAKEKHFQRVLLSEDIQAMNLEKQFPFQKWEKNINFLKTTK